MRRLDRRDAVGHRRVAVLRGGADLRSSSGGARFATDIRPVQVLPPRPRGERREVSLARGGDRVSYPLVRSSVAMRARPLRTRLKSEDVAIDVTEDFIYNAREIRFFFVSPFWSYVGVLWQNRC